jgi:hypothetical protein
MATNVWHGFLQQYSVPEKSVVKPQNNSVRPGMLPNTTIEHWVYDGVAKGFRANHSSRRTGRERKYRGAYTLLEFG